MNITNETAYIIGALRDGCFTKNDKHHIYRIRIYQKNYSWIKQVSMLLEKSFGKKPKITRDKRDSVWCLTINSKDIYEKIVKMAEYPGNQKKWCTPKVIMKSSDDIKKNYIMGFFDSEGGVSRVDLKKFKNKDIRIYFCQANEKVLKELRKILLNFRIKCGKVSGPYFKKNYNSPVFGLRIHGIKEISKFHRCVGSLHEEKRTRLEIISNMSS